MKPHDPVMVTEVLNQLHIKKGEKYIDATLGAGGHSIEIARVGGEVLGIDADKRMLEIARCQVRSDLGIKIVQGNFREIKEIAQEHGFSGVHGILFDLGVSSVHFDDGRRGFSFQKEDEPLDMRLNPEAQAVTAAELLNGLRRDQLEEMFRVVETRHDARKLAKKVVQQRDQDEFETVGDLVRVVDKARAGKIHPATKIFLALRIAVNEELENLKEALPKGLELLKKGSRMVVISFHSAEDGMVKRMFRDWEKRQLGAIETKKAVKPSEDEVERNPRARSARMRVFTKK